MDLKCVVPEKDWVKFVSWVNARPNSDRIIQMMTLHDGVEIQVIPGVYVRFVEGKESE